MIFEAILFGKFKRTIDQQAAEIRMLNSQLQVRNGEVEELTKELQRTRAAADRQAVQMNERHNKARAERRGLIKAIGGLIAKSSHDHIVAPELPNESLIEVIGEGCLALQQRGVNPEGVVLSIDQIAMLRNELPQVFQLTENGEKCRIFGFPVVRK